MSTRKSSKHSKNDWELFSNFKQRGEWVELLFMAKAALRHFAISKPWGDTQAYDVGIEYGPNSLRVQLLRHLIIVSPTREESRKPLFCNRTRCWS